MGNPSFGRDVPWTKASVCRTCEREIRRDGQGVWRHLETGSPLCVRDGPLYVAEPVAEQLSLDEEPS